MIYYEPIQTDGLSFLCYIYKKHTYMDKKRLYEIINEKVQTELLKQRLAESILDTIFNFAEKVAFALIDKRRDILIKTIESHPKMIKIARELQDSKDKLDLTVAKYYKSNPEFRKQIDILRSKGKV